MTATNILAAAAAAIESRAAQRDQPDGERVAARAVRIFNAITGRYGTAELDPLEGWLFMIALKLARSRQGNFHLDDYIDMAAYAALAGECAAAQDAAPLQPLFEIRET